AVGRAGYIGARLVGKVKDHSVSARMDRDRGEEWGAALHNAAWKGVYVSGTGACFHGLHAIALTHWHRKISGRNLWQERRSRILCSLVTSFSGEVGLGYCVGLDGKRRVPTRLLEMG